MAECRNCGNKHAHRLHVYYEGKTMRELCNECGYVRSANMPDVYFPGRHTDANIVDGMGNPILIESKGHKQQLLRERGWVEAGLGRHHRMRI